MAVLLRLSPDIRPVRTISFAIRNSEERNRQCRTPGDYKLFSWDAEEDSAGDWFDPEWLKPYETKGESVHLEAADQKTVNLTLIETRSD